MNINENDQNNRIAQDLSTDLLATKLVVPVIGTKIVRRTRLTELFHFDVQNRLTLIVAPAGYGKTTLLGEFVSSFLEVDRAIAWLSLDPHDNQPLRFWTYVVMALKKVYPKLQFDVLQILYGQDDRDEHYYLNSLLNAIAQIHQVIYLILDDYHAITDLSIHTELAYLINNAPANFHLLIASRSKPPIPISHLRVRRQLVEITAQDLSFTFSEAQDFLSSVMHVDIEHDEIVSLLKKTEGWIASLQLAALSLYDHQDQRRFIADFTGSHRHILEYLVDEVLRHLDENIIEFLLKTSVLQELCASLCDAVLDRSDSWEILNEIEAAKLFIIPLDENQTWYRYHSLFVDALQVILKRKDPDIIPQLNYKACMWHRANGNPERAVPYAIAAGDLGLAAEIVDVCAMQALLEFDLLSLVGWINRFSEELIQQRPRLGIYYALASYNLGRLNLIEPKLQVVEQALERARENISLQEDTENIRREIDYIRAALTCIRDDCGQGIKLIEKAIENLPENDTFYYGFLNHYLAFAYESMWDLEAAAMAFSRGSQFAIQHDYPMEHVYSQCELARIRKEQGRLNEAQEIYRRALDFALSAGLEKDWIIHPQAGLADIYLEWNDLVTAHQWMKEAIDYYELLDTSNYSWVYSATLALCSRLVKYQLALGDTSRAYYYYQKLENNIERYQTFSQKLGDVIDIQVRLWLAKADPVNTGQWLKEKVALSGEGSGSTVAMQIARARIYLAEQNPQDALAILDLLDEKARDFGAVERLIEILCLKAMALRSIDPSSQRARAVLYQALALGASHGYLRIFVDAGENIKTLLEELLTAGQDTNPEKAHLSEYIHRILAALEMKPPPILKASTHQPEKETAVISPVENTSLSDREIQVVRMLVQGYTVKEIGLKLIISTNTVKAHIKNIYKSLDVHTRRELVYRAKEAGIL